MLKDIKCLACAQVLFRIGPLDEKGEAWGIFEEDYKAFESIRKHEADQEYYDCPNCHKKNWTAVQPVPGQGAKVSISRVTG